MRLRLLAPLVLFLSLTSSSALIAQASLDARLQGEWRGSGTVTGRASQVSMTWERAVGSAFVRLRFRNQMTEGGGRPAEVFEAHGYYRVAGTGAGTGTWLDSRGYILPVQLTMTPDTWVSVWGSSSTEQGRTTYRLTAADTMEVIDEVRVASTGEYREFGRATMARNVR